MGLVLFLMIGNTLKMPISYWICYGIYGVIYIIKIFKIFDKE